MYFKKRLIACNANSSRVFIFTKSIAYGVFYNRCYRQYPGKGIMEEDCTHNPEDLNNKSIK